VEEGWDWLFIFLQDVLLKQIFRDRDRDRDRGHGLFILATFQSARCEIRRKKVSNNCLHDDKKGT
jgi:hypothetical protein